MTFTEIGALIGAITGAFTVVDRFLLGRLSVSIQRGDYQLRDLCCTNTSKQDLLITKIWMRPKWLGVAYDHSLHAIYDMVQEQHIPVLVKAGETRLLPLIVRKGELLDKACTDLAPFMIVISWRKTRSAWLPQLPAVIFSSAKALRRLTAAK